MKKEIAAYWVSELRSGKYKQGRNQLKFADLYCCLGVLCEISQRGRWNDKDEYVSGDDSRSGFLPIEVQLWAGLQSEKGDLHTKDSLSLLNDAGHDFNAIADIIEQYWEEL
jgi:hypothetical protein